MSKRKGKRPPPPPSIETEETYGTVETPHLAVTFGLEVPDGLPSEEQKRRTARSFQGKDIDDVALKLSEVLLDDRASDLLDDKGGLGEAVAQESGEVIEYAIDHPDEHLPLGELHKPEGAFTLTITEVLGSCKFGERLELPVSLEARELVLVVGTGFDPNDEFAPDVGELPMVPLTYIRFLPRSNHRFASETYAVLSSCVLPMEPATIENWRRDLRYGPANIRPLRTSSDRQFMEEHRRLLLLTGLKRDFCDAEEALATKAATKAEAAALKARLPLERGGGREGCGGGACFETPHIVHSQRPPYQTPVHRVRHTRLRCIPNAVAARLQGDSWGHIGAEGGLQQLRAHVPALLVRVRVRQIHQCRAQGE